MIILMSSLTSHFFKNTHNSGIEQSMALVLVSQYSLEQAFIVVIMIPKSQKKLFAVLWRAFLKLVMLLIILAQWLYYTESVLMMS